MHMECICFVLECFRNDEINIYLQTRSDKFGWLEYLRQFYSFNTVYNDYSKITTENVLVFKLTSNDYSVDHERVISILHLNAAAQLKCKSLKYLTLTPYIKRENVNYTFPVFGRQIPLQDGLNSRTITLVGYFIDSHFDKDTISFIDTNKTYIFNFIIWGSRVYNRLLLPSNVKIYHNVDTITMVDMLNNSKYVLSKKYINYDRFSGQLGLAISLVKPLIIDAKTAEAYSLPGVTFIKNYSEIGDIDLIDELQYRKLTRETASFKHTHLENNDAIFMKFRLDKFLLGALE